MKVSFSTLGCPGAPLEYVVSLATRLGYPGIELRAAQGEPVNAALPKAARREARALLSDGGVEVVCVASYVRLTGALDEPSYDPVVEAEEVVELAVDIGAPLVRVFGGGDRPSAERMDVARRTLADVSVRTRDSGVSVVMETHDAFSRGLDVAGALSGAAGGAGALWDVVHPFRMGETPAETARLLGRSLRHVHIKDVRTPEDGTPVPLGTGIVPLGAVLEELARLRYTGWISVEWERAWYPDIRPADAELPHALSDLRRMSEALGV